MTRKDWLLLVGLSLPWGCSFFFFKVLAAELPPLTIALGRVAIAALVLGAGIGLAGQSVWRIRAHWRGLLGLGLLNNALPFKLFAYGETMVTSGTAAILNALTPILTVLVLRVVDGTRLGWNRAAGAAIGFAGVVVLVGPGGASSALGQAACFGAALCYGLGAPIMARLRQQPPLLIASGQLWASTLLLLPVAALIDRPWALPAPGAGAWAALGGLAVFSTALAYVMYFNLVRSAGPANAMLVTYVLPVTALILGNLALSEPITLHSVFGMGIILAGLALLHGRWLRKGTKPA
ncbi:MAG: DMT family transporter [Acetobacteraceae bacterium]